METTHIGSRSGAGSALRRSIAVLGSLLFVLAVGAQAGAAGPPAEGEPLRVLAASSLTESATQVAAIWEERRSRPVELSFGGSSRLATQIVEGAPADVFLTADPRWTDHLEQRGAIDPTTRSVFASNQLVWVVPTGRERAPEDLDAAAASPAKNLAIGSPNVPAGSYARRALKRGGVWETFAGRAVSAESVKRALQWVAMGEAEAGIVYRTDATRSEDVETAFELPDDIQPTIRYEAAVLDRSRSPDEAESFVAFLTEVPSQKILRNAGFGPPPEEGDSASGRTAISSADAVDEWAAVRLSLTVGLLCVVGGLLPAVLFGWLLARYRFLGKSLVATLLLAPLALPPVVTGFILLRLLGRSGVLGAALAAIGVQVSFTTIGAAVAAFVVSFPLYLLAARSAFELVDARYEEVSRTLGVPPAQTFWRITVPLAAPGLAAGALLTFARAIGEFGATTVLAGNVPGETQTIPLAIYTLLESPGGYGDIWILVAVSLALSLFAVLGFEWLERRQRGRSRPRDH